MRLRIILLAVATSSLVLVSFLLPLALVLRTLAADRAVSTATVQAQWMAPLAATLNTASLRLAVDRVNAENKSTPVTVFLPGGGELGAPVRRSPEVNAALQLAARGRSFTSDAPGGVEVMVAVQGLPGGTAVIRTFVPDAELHHGVTRAWLLLGLVGLLLLVLSVAVADQLARSLVRPLRAVAAASDSLATGDLSARAELTGPPEVRRAGAGLNRLAVRIRELLTHERETVADLSHRLRTPLTALRIDAESLRNHAEREHVLDDLDALERTVDEIIREARRPTQDGPGAACDAGEVVAERAAFWLPLAEDTDRAMTVELASGPMPVRAAGEDVAACMDILLENVFAHTPDGAGLAIRLSRRAGGGAWLVVADDGPGFSDDDLAERGRSSGGSTGLGLDIARRIAEASGGTLTIGRSASGGGSVTVGLGPIAAPEEGSRRHRRTRALPRVLPQHHRPLAHPPAPLAEPNTTSTRTAQTARPGRHRPTNRPSAASPAADLPNGRQHPHRPQQPSPPHQPPSIRLPRWRLCPTAASTRTARNRPTNRPQPARALAALPDGRQHPHSPADRPRACPALRETYIRFLVYFRHGSICAARMATRGSPAGQ